MPKPTTPRGRPAVAGNPIQRCLTRLPPEARHALGIPAGWRPRRGCRTLVLVGPNSSGKSVLARQIGGACTELGMKAAAVSMAMRTSGGFATMTYGLGEQHSGTGVSSVHATLALLRSVATWETPALLLFDEPDIGLADEYAADLAARIAAAIVRPAPAHWGTVVVSHSRVFLGALDQALATAAHRADVLPLHAPGIRTLADWIARPIVPRSVEALEADDLARFRTLAQLARRR